MATQHTKIDKHSTQGESSGDDKGWSTVAPKSQRGGSSPALTHEIPARCVTDAKRWVEHPDPTKGFRGPQMTMHLRGWKKGTRVKRDTSLFVLEGGTAADRKRCYGLIEHRVKTVWSKQGGARRVAARGTSVSQPGTYVSMRAQTRHTGPSAVLKKALFDAIKGTEVRFDLLGIKEGSPELTEYTLSRGTPTERAAVVEQVTLLSEAFSTTYEVPAGFAGGALKKAKKQFVKATSIEFDYKKCGWTDSSKATALYCVVGLCSDDREAFADDVDYFAHQLAEETAELIKRYQAGATVKVPWAILKGQRWKQRYTTHYFRPEEIPKEDWTEDKEWTVASVPVEHGAAFIKKVKDLMGRDKGAKTKSTRSQSPSGGAAEVVATSPPPMSFEAYQAKLKVEKEERRAARVAKSAPAPSQPLSVSDDEDTSFASGGGFDALGAIDPDRTGETVKPSKRALKRQAKQEAADKEATEQAAQQAATEELEQTLMKRGCVVVPHSELTFLRCERQETAEDRQHQRLEISKQKFIKEQARCDLAARYASVEVLAKVPRVGKWAKMAAKDPKVVEVELQMLLPTKSFSSAETIQKMGAQKRAVTGVKRLAAAARVEPSYEICQEDVDSYHAEDREVPGGWDSDEEE